MNYEDQTETCMDEIERVTKALNQAQNHLFTARLAFREASNSLKAMLAEPNQDDPEVVSEVADARRWVAEAGEDIARWHAARAAGLRRLAAAATFATETLDLIDPAPAAEEPAPDASALDRAKSAEYRYFDARLADFVIKASKAA
jgi:hypothetical protein